MEASHFTKGGPCTRYCGMTVCICAWNAVRRPRMRKGEPYVSHPKEVEAQHPNVASTHRRGICRGRRYGRVRWNLHMRRVHTRLVRLPYGHMRVMQGSNLRVPFVGRCMRFVGMHSADGRQCTMLRRSYVQRYPVGLLRWWNGGAMSATPRRLRLNTQTLRQLTNWEASEAVGAG